MPEGVGPSANFFDKFMINRRQKRAIDTNLPFEGSVPERKGMKKPGFLDKFIDSRVKDENTKKGISQLRSLMSGK